MINDLTFDEESHIYKWEGQNVPSVTSIIKNQGFIDDRWYQEQDAIRGNYVHLSSQYYCKSILDYNSLDPIIKPYVDAFIMFMKYSGFKMLFSEMMVFNNSRMYAGTLDLLGMLNGEYVLIDIKSGCVPKWVELQLNGYADSLIDMKCKEPKKIISLQLKKDGKFNLKEWRRSGIFGSLINMYNWKKGV